MKRIGSSNSIILTGLGFALIGFAGRYVVRRLPQFENEINQIFNQFRSPSASTFSEFTNEKNSRYYKGGFDPRMNLREASLILGVSPSARKSTVRAAFLRIMYLNHPDKGGSPYIASKINEAKDFLEGKGSN